MVVHYRLLLFCVNTVLFFPFFFFGSLCRCIPIYTEIAKFLTEEDKTLNKNNTFDTSHNDYVNSALTSFN